jgi:hypothetical protein
MLVGGCAYAAGRIVAIARRFGPGVAGPVVIVASVAQWSRPAAGVLAGLMLLAYDVVRGLQERPPRPVADEPRVDGGPR